MLNYMSAWANCSSYHSGRGYDSQIERIKGKRGPLVLLFPKIQFFLMMSICSQVSFCVLQLCSPDLLSVTTKPAPQTKSYSGLFHGVWSCRLLAGWESTASGGGFFFRVGGVWGECMPFLTSHSRLGVPETLWGWCPFKHKERANPAVILDPLTK